MLVRDHGGYLIDRGAAMIVLSLGMEERLQVDPATVVLLDPLGVPYRAAQTLEAAAIYNAAEVPVGGLFHSTC
ncbi:hypothetical protein GCM10009830_31610 [Glycomyces endophyticus]|uniref:Uncharacterized protein n=1 Tax=Glycomyces endophyticus TaxID=480996 RepID=A0ABN2H667_9ACTN